jgi:predicted ATP-dependent serine protease
MIARGSVTLICAESGTGKTWLGYFLAGRVAQGRDVLGRAVRQSRVLYLDGENPVYMVKQRFFDLGISETPNLTVWGGWNISPPAGPASRAVVEFARKYQPLIIYDSLIEFHPGSEQSSSETRAFMRNFRALANMGATVVILHHTGKAETAKQYRGSSDIKAAVDTAYLLEGADENTPEIRKLTLNCFKSRLALGRNFSMEFRRGLGFVAAESRKVTEIIDEVLREHPGSNQSEVIKLCAARGCSKSQVEAALKNGNWETKKGPKNAKVYTLPNPETSHDEAGL